MAAVSSKFPVGHDISPDFRWNRRDAKFFTKLMAFEGTGEAIVYFSRNAWKLSDYAYWFGLGTLWVSYSGWSDLDLWIKLFSSKRPNRETGLMKPSELEQFSQFPDTLQIFRAHRPEEKRWISYSLFPKKAAEFASRRGASEVKEYAVRKRDALALFLRRGEYEVLILDQTQAVHVRTIPVLTYESL